jgi:hypothetical protein
MVLNIFEEIVDFLRLKKGFSLNNK